MTAQSRINDLAALVRASGQTKDVKETLAVWLSLGAEARMIGFRLPLRRVMCPSCGMHGASFEACERCGGPACDNCRNRARRLACCSLCSGAA